MHDANGSECSVQVSSLKRIFCKILHGNHSDWGDFYMLPYMIRFPPYYLRTLGGAQDYSEIVSTVPWFNLEKIYLYIHISKD